MVDALVLGTSSERIESSSLSPSTKLAKPSLHPTDFLIPSPMKIPFLSKKDPSKTKLGSVTFTLRNEKDFKDYVKYLTNPWQIFWRNFLAGTAQGVGILLGTALFLTILGYITNKIMGELPFFSDFAQAINVWLQTTLDKQ